ncbi:Amino-acid permease inda1 [Stygiomarasmius scandens]|uniref:Amino-acid permease inda1 n=1 Tax=Marasmiellus scandens TaxID=2682957 RepID=A0ABR1JD33_9AGAR
MTALAETGYAPNIFSYVDKSSRPLFSVILGLAFAPLAYINVSATSDILTGSLPSPVFQPLLPGDPSACASMNLVVVRRYEMTIPYSIRFRRAWQVQGHSFEELPFQALGGAWGSWLGLILVVLVIVTQFYVALFPIGGLSSESARAQSFFQAFLAIPVMALFWIIGYTWKRSRPWRAHETGRKFWLTVEQMRVYRVERAQAPIYVKIYRMLFAN